MKGGHLAITREVETKLRLDKSNRSGVETKLWLDKSNRVIMCLMCYYEKGVSR
jgi:hypothetical protein